MRRREFLLTAGGAAGTTVGAATAGSAAAAEEESGGEGTTHTVDMNDQLVFDPDSITIAPGDTIEWVNSGSVGHSVTAYEDGIPGEAAYFASGGFDSEDAAREDWQGPQEGNVPGGESYSHTFEVEGTYEYFCIPHEGAGMVGEIQVSSDAGQGGGGGGGVPRIPDSAKTIGIASVVALFGTLGLAFSLLKYGGQAGEG